MNLDRSLARCLLVLILSASLSACSTVAGWFDSDDEDPTAPVELIDIDTSINMKKIWSTGVGKGQGTGLYKIQPVLDGNTLYVASSKGQVYAIGRERGKKLWDAKLETDLSGGVGAYAGSLFVGGADGSVMRLSAENGELLWSTRVTGEVLAPPQGDGRMVVAQTYDGKLHGLDHDSGEKIWTYDSNVPVLTVRGTSTPILRSNVVYAGFANGRVLAFNADSGDIKWEVRVAISQGRSEIERIVDVDGTMALVGNELYAASYQGRIVAIDAASGRKLWQNNVSSFSGVSQGFGNVYVADEDGTLYAFQRNGQGERWSQPSLGYRELSRPTPVSSYVAVADLEGIVHFISQVDGEFAGRTKIDGDGARADMIADGNILYVLGNSGKLVALEITSKE